MAHPTTPKCIKSIISAVGELSCAIVSLESVMKLRAATIHRFIKNSGAETHIDAIEQARHETDIKSSADATAENIICMNANSDMPPGMLNISRTVDSSAETMGNISFFISRNSPWSMLD